VSSQPYVTAALPPGKESLIKNRKLDGPQSQFGHFEEKENL